MIILKQLGNCLCTLQADLSFSQVNEQSFWASLSRALFTMKTGSYPHPLIRCINVQTSSMFSRLKFHLVFIEIEALPIWTGPISVTLFPLPPPSSQHFPYHLIVLGYRMPVHLRTSGNLTVICLVRVKPQVFPDLPLFLGELIR